MQNGLRLVLIALVGVELGHSKPSLCERPVLANGVVSMQRYAGYMWAYFKCNPSYDLIGSNYATCSWTKWSYPVPVCATSGCIKSKAPENGFAAMNKNGTTIYVHCKDGFTLAGEWRAYCNGTQWNPPLGTCSDITSVPLSCDFETGECGWTNDKWNVNNWIRTSSVSASLLGGPNHDHTTMQTNSGHFMMLQFGVKTSNASLLSPVYPAELSRDACFHFWYSTFGSGAQFIDAYVQTASKKLPITKPGGLTDLPSSQLGKLWKLASFSVPAVSKNFQFLIRIIKLYSNGGGIVIDDVKLMAGSECSPLVDKDDKDSVPLSCDFEADLCGWTNDDWNGDNWIRTSSTNDSRLRGGPTHDHTTMQTNGHFMLLELDEGLRLSEVMSPIYPAELNTDACFYFWYYAYGDWDHSFYVFVKPHYDFQSLLNDPLEYLHHVEVDGGNVWKMGSYSVIALNESFQICIRTAGKMLDKKGMAIDDVKLMRGSECSQHKDPTTRRTKTTTTPGYMTNRATMSIKPMWPLETTTPVQKENEPYSVQTIIVFGLALLLLVLLLIVSACIVYFKHRRSRFSANTDFELRVRSLKDDNENDRAVARAKRTETSV